MHTRIHIAAGREKNIIHASKVREKQTNFIFIFCIFVLLHYRAYSHVSGIQVNINICVYVLQMLKEHFMRGKQLLLLLLLLLCNNCLWLKAGVYNTTIQILLPGIMWQTRNENQKEFGGLPTFLGRGKVFDSVSTSMSQH